MCICVHVHNWADRDAESPCTQMCTSGYFLLPHWIPKGSPRIISAFLSYVTIDATRVKASLLFSTRGEMS